MQNITSAPALFSIVSKIIMETTKKQIELQQWQKLAIFAASSAAGFWLGLHSPTALPYAPHNPFWDVLKESILLLFLFAFVPFVIAMICKTWRWFLVGTCIGSLFTYLAGLGLRYLFTK